MALSSRTKNKLTDAVNTCFHNIGKKNGTAMPSSERNEEPIAYELWLASQLSTLADKRKALAQTVAAREGVINDKEKDPKPPGTREVIYNGDVVSIALEVRQPATRVDADRMIDFLIQKGISSKLLFEAKDYATVQNRASHVFSPMLIANGLS